MGAKHHIKEDWAKGHWVARGEKDWTAEFVTLVRVEFSCLMGCTVYIAFVSYMKLCDFFLYWGTEPRAASPAVLPIMNMVPLSC